MTSLQNTLLQGRSTHEDGVTKPKQRFSALECEISAHPAQLNEITQARPSAAEHSSDEDVVLDVADQDGYESDTESDCMSIGDAMPSTTKPRPAHYGGRQQSSRDFADGSSYPTGKQRESLPNPPDPSMLVDYRVNS